MNVGVDGGCPRRSGRRCGRSASHRTAAATFHTSTLDTPTATWTAAGADAAIPRPLPPSMLFPSRPFPTVAPLLLHTMSVVAAMLFVTSASLRRGALAAAAASSAAAAAASSAAAAAATTSTTTTTTATATAAAAAAARLLA